MTATAHRTADAGRLNVYGNDGQIVATVGQARSEWLGWLLAECDRGHCYMIDDDATGCPVCQATGATETG